MTTPADAQAIVDQGTAASAPSVSKNTLAIMLTVIISAISTVYALLAPIASPTFTGVVTIPFTQSGTGAVATTVLAKLGQTVSVTDYGAKGNGVTSDTAAIQKTITAACGAPATPAKVTFPGGGYWLVDGPISSPSGCAGLVVEGLGTAATTIYVMNHNYDVFTSAAADPTFRNLKFLGTGTPVGGFVFNLSGQNPIIDGVDFYSVASGITSSSAKSNYMNLYMKSLKASSGIGILFTGSNEVRRVANLVFEGDPGAGQPYAAIAVRGGAGYKFSALDVFKCGVCLSLEPTSGVVSAVYLGNSYLDTSNYGFRSNPTGGATVQRVSFSNVWIAGHTTIGAQVTGATQGFICSACSFLGNTNEGLDVLGTNNNAINISGSTFAGNGSTAAHIHANVSDFSITSSMFGPYAGYSNNPLGIGIDAGTSDNYVISLNTVITGGSGAISDGGTGTHKVVSPNAIH